LKSRSFEQFKRKRRDNAEALRVLRCAERREEKTTARNGSAACRVEIYRGVT
jgi:hypothetical protein